MNFVTGLPVSTNLKAETYNSILVIVNQLMTMIYYKPVKVIINTSDLAKIIIKAVLQHHGLSGSIVSDCGSVFTSKF